MGSASGVLAVIGQTWRIRLLTMLEYKANFFMWFAFTIAYHGVAIAALGATLYNFPSLAGWSFREVAFLYALWMLGHSTHNLFFFSVGEVPVYVQEGSFDRFLVRPRDVLFQIVSVPNQQWPDELVLAIAWFAFATWYAHVRVDAVFLVAVPLVVVGGVLIDLAISLAIATLSFWFVRVDTLRWVVMSLEQEFTRYPVSIYTRGVRILLAYVLPYAFMNYFPAVFFLHKTGQSLAVVPWLGLLAPAVGGVWFAAAYAFWHAGLNRYQGTGS